MSGFNFKTYSIRHYKLDNYVFADKLIKKEVNGIISRRMSDIDTLIILSTEGNGGTYLTCSILKRMMEYENDFASISGDDYKNISKMPPVEFVEICKPYTYIVFDNIEVGCSNESIYAWLKDAFELLRKTGKKTLATYTVQDKVDLIVPEFINSARHQLFYSLSNPTIYPEIVKKCFNEFGHTVSEDIVNRIAANKDINVRELESRCLMYYVENFLLRK